MLNVDWTTIISKATCSSLRWQGVWGLSKAWKRPNSRPSEQRAARRCGKEEEGVKLAVVDETSLHSHPRGQLPLGLSPRGSINRMGLRDGVHDVEMLPL